MTLCVNSDCNTLGGGIPQDFPLHSIIRWKLLQFSHLHNVPPPPPPPPMTANLNEEHDLMFFCFNILSHRNLINSLLNNWLGVFPP